MDPFDIDLTLDQIIELLAEALGTSAEGIELALTEFGFSLPGRPHA